MKLSIITINYNNAEGLRKTIESVLMQTFGDFEYIIVDGASTDGSVEIIHSLMTNSEWLTAHSLKWLSEPDAGIYNAMNKGIQMAKGEYCLFLNSGDYLYAEDVLEKALVGNFTEDIVYGNQMVSDGHEMKMGIYNAPEYLTFNAYLTSCLPHQSTFIRRDMFDKIGLYNENNRIVSDWEWFAVALFRYNCTLRHINIVIAVYDTNGISSSQEVMAKHEQEKHECLMRNFPRFMPDSNDYFNLLRKYKHIPRVIRAISNRLHKYE